MLSYHIVENFNILWRLAVAQGVLILFFMLDTAALFSYGALDMRPFFLMAGIFYWSIYRPGLLPFLWVFLLGIGYDAFIGSLFGLQALLFLIIRYVLMRQRTYLLGLNFTMIWLNYSVMIALYFFIEWLTLSLLSWHVMPMVGAVIKSGMSILTFPAIYCLLFFIHKIMPDAPVSRLKR